MRVENLHIEESAIKAGAPQTVCLDVQSSVIISVGGITRENFSTEVATEVLALSVHRGKRHPSGLQTHL